MTTITLNLKLILLINHNPDLHLDKILNYYMINQLKKYKSYNNKIYDLYWYNK